MDVVVVVKTGDDERVLIMGRLLNEVAVERVLISSDGMRPADIMALAHDGKMPPAEIADFLTGEGGYRDVGAEHPVLRLQALASAVTLLMRQQAEGRTDGQPGATQARRDQRDPE